MALYRCGLHHGAQESGRNNCHSDNKEQANKFFHHRQFTSDGDGRAQTSAIKGWFTIGTGLEPPVDPPVLSRCRPDLILHNTV